MVGGAILLEESLGGVSLGVRLWVPVLGRDLKPYM